ncbi:anaerobic ribonucleoside-triphosphate reductase activating protein [Thermotalea metallivorans]|uniref:Radical SAM core domain-containing protein n=1 Tax=Thermotalea metallivorans TaxID=520762 RepID=A0A140LDN3_9FIRM|nr:anaerobic ribonucleoside-triphosphate reductase activating protein [Thermotalea metallivorans]KXG78658.1 hypothetical protein AN619_01840 [Thermotalea metallivorans]
MHIIGQEKTSLIDYPDKICTVYFTAGCNFKCPYCHNGSIVRGEGNAIEDREIFSFLQKRKKFIDGVCISGGEPTLYPDLYEFVQKIKEMGFLIKLDTNGTNPFLLKRLLEEKWIDYVAMDLKAPLEKYETVVKVPVDPEKIRSSIHMIMNGNVDYEFRTTVCKELLLEEDILAMAQEIKGSKRYYLQNFRDGDTILEGKGRFTPYDREVLEAVKQRIEGLFDICRIR